MKNLQDDEQMNVSSRLHELKAEIQRLETELDLCNREINQIRASNPGLRVSRAPTRAFRKGPVQQTFVSYMTHNLVIIAFLVFMFLLAGWHPFGWNPFFY